MIEILSPAGDFESVKAAVRSGADAVYLGLADFNARRNAENFNDEKLREAIKYCKIRGVKVHITLNTLVSDKELSNAVNCAKFAASSGADAFIVADLGLAKALKECIPEIPLHASTQMSVQSPSALPLLKQMGFSRVVIARECDKQTIEEMCIQAKKLGLEIEVFVHGALCMCVSGQCLLSSMIGGRSGNRGLCAQPCRLPFAVKNGTGYDLSLKDMSLVDYIGELKELGVASLKIEGRMKNPEYVSVATAVCRKAADGEEIPECLREMLCKAFSRDGFSDGYYTKKTGREMFGVRSKTDLEITKSVESNIHSLYRNERQSIPLNIDLKVKRNENIVLSVNDGENCIEVSGWAPQTAQNAPLSEEYAKRCIAKLGGTPYFAESFTSNIDDGLTALAGDLKAMRREAIELLSQKRAEIKNTQILDFNIKKFEKTAKTKKEFFARFKSVSQIPENLSNISAIILPLEEVQKAENFEVPIFAELPRGLIGNEPSVIKMLENCARKGIKKALCGNLANINMCNEIGIEPIADIGLNIFNSYSASVLELLGVKSGVLSVENSVDAINGLSSEFKTGIISYGRVPLMLTKNCPNKNGDGCKNCGGISHITDRLGIEFPIVCQMGFCEILNSKPLYLLDRLNEFKTDFAVLYFTTEQKDECEKVISEITAPKKPNYDFTRGLYYRSVK